MFSVFEILNKKSNSKELTNEELEFMVNGFVDGSIPDYQFSAFLMSIKINKLTNEEIYKLVDLYIKSGDQIKFKDDIFVVDKHSTGGVGDKISLILAPLAASLGLKMGKFSGRGLGHTGGTVDKLESIKGFNIEMTLEDFVKHVTEDGIALIGQTEKLCVADKKIYALRDTTATVESVGLIAASIMSKKIASGSNSILLDVKAGSGGFFNKEEDLKEFIDISINIGKNKGRDTRVVVTNMDQPLGNKIGNISELMESLDILNGKGPEDVIELVTYQAAILLSQANKTNDKFEEFQNQAKENLNNGKAFKMFEKWMKIQGVKNWKYNPKMLNPKNKVQILADTDGYVNIKECSGFGMVGVELGAGRKTKADVIDFQAGITLFKKQNDKVSKNDIIAELYSDKVKITKEIIAKFNKLYSIEKINPNKNTDVVLKYIYK